jgi:demethylmenaquinone methyltransferase/2-methoxy-6-polyprenyl-1,4-benzoquinol methylase
MTPRPEDVIEKYRRSASTYDHRTSLAESARQRAIGRLQLCRGDVVLDVACGTGNNFEAIEAAIGEDGRLIGIELSPDMAVRARERVQANRWTNVMLLESSVENARIPERVDAILFSFTHDVLRSQGALSNVFRHSNPGVRVAATGSKWAAWWVFPVNAYTWYVARKYVTTFAGLGRPWTLLAEHVPDLRIDTFLFGATYVAWGKGAGS